MYSAGRLLSFHLPLPQLSYGFYGRRREYRAIRDGILAKNQRAVIVYGMGGIGKTALISYIATRIRDNFKGVYAFDCTSATLAPELILLELHRYLEAQGVGVLRQLIGQSTPPDRLGAFVGQVLSQWPLLLIFDNFETQLTPQDSQRHKITDANLGTFLKTLVQTTATGTRFLFTTRYLFDLDAGRIGDTQQVVLDDLSRPEAVWLMQKLPYLRTAYYWDKLKAFAIFGGHPYALVTLDRHCAHRLLAEALGDARTVHAELREFLAIEMNYARLSARAQELLNRLAVFRKPVPHGAAEWVLGSKADEKAASEGPRRQLTREAMPEGIQAMRDEESLRESRDDLREVQQADSADQPIDELIEWALLTPQEEDGQIVALRVHGLVREFCRNKVTDADWERNLGKAAAFYTNQTKPLRDDSKSLLEISLEIEAFELLFEAGDYEQAASLLISATFLGRRWGLGSTLQSLYERVVHKVNKKTRSGVVHNLGVLLQERGDYEKALECYERSREIKEELGDREGVSTSLHQIGRIHHVRGSYEEALQFYEQSRKIKEELGDRDGVSMLLHNIGVLHQARGDYEEALQFYEQSRRIREELGDRDGVSLSLHNIGIIHQARGDYEQALLSYEQARKLFEELGDRAGLSASLHNIARIHRAQGNYERALQFCEQARELCEELGDRAGLSKSLHEIGVIHQFGGNYDQALRFYEQAQSIHKELGDRAGLSASLHQIGMIHQARSNYEQALLCYEQARTIDEELGDRVGLSKSLHSIGIIHQFRGDYGEALRFYGKSREIKEELGDRVGLSKSLHNIGIILQARGDYEQALRFYEQARTIEEELGERAGLSSSLHLIGMIHHDRGDYEEALGFYEQSQKIREELSDRAGLAESHGEIGILLTDMKRYPESLDQLLAALSIFSELRSPNTEAVMGAIVRLRRTWGTKVFDRAWHVRTRQDTPEWLKKESDASRWM